MNCLETEEVISRLNSNEERRLCLAGRHSKFWIEDSMEIPYDVERFLDPSRSRFG